MPLPAQCCRLERATVKMATAPRFVIARRPQADVAISGRQLRFRRKYPIIRPSTARFPRRFAPRNGNSDSLAPPNHHCNTRNCRRRSLSAATDAIGWYVLIGSLQTASAFPRLPRPLRGLAMTNLWLSPFYRRPASVGGIAPGGACPSPTTRRCGPANTIIGSF